MNHVKYIPQRKQALFDGVDAKDIDTQSGVTARNMVKNYEIISTVWTRSCMISTASKRSFSTFCTVWC